MINTAHINSIWSDIIVQELVRHGVTCFCCSSGARCGPLLTAITRHPDIEPVTHFDERASAFYALGHARARRAPAVWVTTSGTAAANGLPAVIEAAQDRIPLILLTADRPPELRDTGANQTIDQVRLFASYTRWQGDVPCPDTALPPSFVLTTVDQAVARATGADAGPVHLNLMFREPLADQEDDHDYSGYLSGLGTWLDSDKPFTEPGAHLRTPTPQTMDTIAGRLGKPDNGLLVVGRLDDEPARRAARELARMLPWPAFVDVASGLRLGKQQTDHIIPFADQILLAADAGRKPDFILHFGGPLVSKRIQAYAAECAADAPYMLIKSHGERQDPAHCVRYALEVHFPSFMTALRARNVKARPARHLKSWQEDSRNVARVLEEFAADDGAVDEVYVAATLSRHVPETYGLFLASSMPVRDMDMYAFADGADVPVAANRGASGIDGTVASACGWAHAMDRPAVAVVGDLACLHDLNALQYMRPARQPVVLVVVNNDGGGIFSFLPLAGQEDVFETCFGTPHGMTFEHAARQFDLPYAQPETRTEFLQALSRSFELGRSCLLEVRTNRDANAELHKDLQTRIRDALTAG